MNNLNLVLMAAVAAAARVGGAAQAQTVRVDGVVVPVPVYGADRARAQTRSDSNATSVSTAQGGTAYGTQGQSLSIDNHSTGAVSSAVAPMLVTSNDTCMGSTSLGASAMSFGVSFGTSYTDDNCLMLKNSRELWNMGFRGAALARMCMDERNRAALEATGVNCPSGSRGGRAWRD